MRTQYERCNRQDGKPMPYVPREMYALVIEALQGAKR